MAIRRDHTLNVRNGNAVILVIKRGLRISAQELLSMTDQKIRNELRSAIWGVVFRRPNIDGFPADALAVGNPSTPISSLPQMGAHIAAWIDTLREVFEHRAIVQTNDAVPSLYALVWCGFHITILVAVEDRLTMSVRFCRSLHLISTGQVAFDQP